MNKTKKIDFVKDGDNEFKKASDVRTCDRINCSNKVRDVRYSYNLYPTVIVDKQTFVLCESCEEKLREFLGVGGVDE